MNPSPTAHRVLWNFLFLSAFPRTFNVAGRASDKLSIFLLTDEQTGTIVDHH